MISLGGDAMNLVMIVLKGTLVLLIALGLTVALRRSPAGARHLVWMTTLATILLFPMLARWEPLRLEVLPAFSPSITAALPLASSTAVQPNPAPSSPRRARNTDGSSADAQTQLNGSRSPFPSPATLLAITWLTGAAALIGWLLLGMLAVRRILGGGRTLDDASWTTPLYEVADRMNLETIPRIVMSSRVEMPFACGILKPTIVFPSTADSWSDERRRVVLFHELAHIKRRDLIGHAVGRLACALYWFHPLVWTAARQLRAESERACDDLVLACGARASDYVGHLLDIVSGVRRSGAPVTALPMARKKEFEGRMLAILDPTIPRGAPGRAQSALISVGVLLITLSIAAAVPATAVGETAVAAIPTDPAIVTGDTVQRVPTAPALSAAEEVAPARPRAVELDERIPVATERSRTREQTRDIASTSVRQRERAYTWSAAPFNEATAAGDRVETLIRVLSTDSDEDVRVSAAWALARVRDPRATAALTNAIRRDRRSDVREMAVWALIQSGTATTAGLVEALRDDESGEVRETAAWGLGERGSPDALPALMAAMRDDHAEVRRTAIWALGNQRSREPATAIAAALQDEDDEVRLQAAWALGQLRSPATTPALRAAFARETDTEVRRAIFRALALLGDDSEEFLELAMKSPDSELRSRAVRVLAGQGPGIWPWPWPWPRPRPSP